MKTILMIILLMVLFPSFACSGEIYGCIKKGKKLIRDENIKIRIEITPDGDKEITYSTPHKCGTYNASLDKFGTYRLYVNENGKCLLKLYVVLGEENEEQKTQIGDERGMAVYSYENSVRYDLLIKEEDDGKHSLWRK
ncbi:MAG TPA: hypothetical protein ACFYEF_11190 [Candidatus Wunengus sp. YC63]|uniref:hypothetical protein n=1 Tax=Candidatus Wunengus sp. YC63 TaxID=3367699 RepID=UPI0027130DD2|nr:hypothetical protein [Candidatus Brocadiales bacterium]